ncbi:tryptophan halogenase family protein [Nitrospirillum iridis]|uniref:Tryptophan halogenase n=1 Tax=Nitrospirillum iridis TaxID=765888 RepID=A0A7X0AZ21_9PROT|nr:tryptophan halogenase family protein [Nitrospirillum iridis]MBB6251981.1 tryptophan halogenase [Nitrospirillum iridis]
MTPLRRILIVGGGTAGWMAACALNQAVRLGGTRVELVESDAIGTVGVGEATVPSIRQFNQDIGLDEATFMKATQGTFKLGIEFRDWRAVGTRFFHGFGDTVVNTGPFSTLNHWLVARDLVGDAAGEFDAYHMAAVMAHAGRFTVPETDPRSPYHYFSYAYHFDAGLYARLLRTKAEREGVVRHEGRITGTNLDPETGFIRGVRLEDGRDLLADLFIDCSGFVSLLADKVLGEPFLDYSHWLPVDRAWAVPCAGHGPLLPYTRATALEGGWQWRIPLQHRTGNGYVFSSAHVSEDEARARLLDGLDGAALDEPRLLRFKTGRRQRFWARNCVAIGLSSGFVEPLESTSISLIQGGITRLIGLLPDQGFNPALAAEYNRIQALEFDRIRDFIIMHYALNGRDDTAFWRERRSMALPDSLAERIETFRETGHVVLLNEETFVTPSWQALFVGLGLIPTRRDPLMAVQKREDIVETLRLRRNSLAQAASRLPTHADFIARHCRAGA